MDTADQTPDPVVTKSMNRGSVRLKGMAPLEKQQFVAASFLRKVEVMEEMTKRPMKVGDWWPSNLRELREWSDPTIGAVEWSDQHADSPSGPNQDLRRRFDAAKAKLDARSPEHRLKVALAENRRLKNERDSLAAQNMMLMAELRSARDVIERAGLDKRPTSAQVLPLKR